MRRALPVALLALGAAGGALAVVHLLGRVGTPATPGLPAGQTVAVRGSLEPAAHLFGDRVVARLDVALDRRRIDPRRVRLQASFRPYAVLRREVSRRDAGDLVYLRYVFRLRCLEIACIPRRQGPVPEDPGRAERHTIELPPARLALGTPDPRVVRWPPLESVSRINAARYRAYLDYRAAPWQGLGQSFPFLVDLSPRAPTYRVAPRLLAGVALALALLLLAVPGRLVVRDVRRRRRSPAEAWAGLPPLARALLVADWAARSEDGEGRRRALDLAADDLRRSGRLPLAREAWRLAWADGPPTREAVSTLAREIRAAAEERHGR